MMTKANPSFMVSSKLNEMKVAVLFVLYVFLQRSEAKCSPAEYGAVLSYGDSCQLKCRCLGNEQCDHETGQCPSGCAPGWAGPGCQYANLALNRNTSQRETAEGNPGFEPKSAVDGNVNTCSKTQDEEPRWCVNLGMKRYVVGLNIIVPQRDPVSLDRITIYISNESYTDDEKKLGFCFWQDTPIPNDVTRTKYEIMCFKPLIGQFLIIHKRLPTRSQLELCEVQVYGGRELGFRKPSAQSSTLQSHITEAFNALDGRAVDSDMLQCSVTKKTANPKWSVDLGMLYKIHRIVIHNLETDDTRSSLVGFVVVINKATSSASDYIYTYEESYINQTTEVNLLSPVVGRYVTIRLPGQDKQIVLCEIDIFGDCPTNQCGNDCSSPCWCNNTLTGDAQLTGTCPYKCSDQVESISMPNCNKGFPTSAPTTTSSKDNSAAGATDNSAAGANDDSAARVTANSAAGATENSAARATENSAAGATDNSAAGATDDSTTRAIDNTGDRENNQQDEARQDKARQATTPSSSSSLHGLVPVSKTSHFCLLLCFIVIWY